mmetsp:Transcript_1917/g.1374  ORF Transcript_1917/g.1374 Transcript_1917/m.1374 type:complete len:86 (-) Transcript_1917:803-1060(-)
MYQGGSQNKGASAEDFLLGKPVKDSSKEQEKQAPYGKPIVPVIRDGFATAENEAFTKMVEDPLVHIKSMELQQRQQVADNPLLMK